MSNLIGNGANYNGADISNAYLFNCDGLYYASCGGGGGTDNGYAYNYYGSGGFGAGGVSGGYDNEAGPGYNGIIAIAIPIQYS